MNKKKKKNILIFSSIMVALLLLAYFGGFIQTIFYFGPVEVPVGISYVYPEPPTSISFSGAKSSTNIMGSTLTTGIQSINVNFKNSELYWGKKWSRNTTLKNYCLQKLRGWATGTSCWTNANQILTVDTWRVDTINSVVKFNGESIYANCSSTIPRHGSSMYNEKGYNCSGYGVILTNDGAQVWVNTNVTNITSGFLEFNIILIEKSTIQPIIPQPETNQTNQTTPEIINITITVNQTTNLSNGTTIITPINITQQIICPANTVYNKVKNTCEYTPQVGVNCPPNYIYNPALNKCETSPTSISEKSNTLYYIIGGIFAVLIGIILWVKYGGKRK